MKKTNEFRLTLDARSVNEGFARVAVSAFAAPLDPTLEELADLKTAVSEAVTNCIVHGYKDCCGKIYIHTVLLDPPAVRVTVRDKGCGIADVPQAMTPLYTTGEGERAGLGFTVMESFCDKHYRQAKMVTAERERQIRENLGLVHTVANRFRGRGIEYDDLYQSGCVGLIKAVDRFDPTLGYAFSTYAVPVIIGEIKRLFRDGGAVKVSRVLKEKALHAARLREDFLRREGREPTIGELAELLSCDPAEAAEIVGVMQPTVSINSAGEDGDATLDIPVDDSEQLFDRLTVLQAMDGLEKSEQMLVELRYYKGLTQCKTAEILGLSQVQVSRKEKAVLQKMRRVMDG